MNGTRDPAGLGRTVIVLVYVLLVLEVFSSATALNTIRVLGGFGGGIASRPALEAADRYSALAGGLYLVGLVVTGIMALHWIHRCVRNAHVFSDAMTMSPRWTIGSFFVPIANLFTPFRGVRETWQASVDPIDPDSVPIPGMMRLWWGAWIAASLGDNAQFRLSLRAESVDQLIAVGWFEVANLPVDIVLTIAFAWLIRRLSALQSAAIDGSEVARVFE